MLCFATADIFYLHTQPQTRLLCKVLHFTSSGHHRRSSCACVRENSPWQTWGEWVERDECEFSLSFTQSCQESECFSSGSCAVKISLNVFHSFRMFSQHVRLIAMPQIFKQHKKFRVLHSSRIVREFWNIVLMFGSRFLLISDLKIVFLFFPLLFSIPQSGSWLSLSIKCILFVLNFISTFPRVFFMTCSDGLSYTLA